MFQAKDIDDLKSSTDDELRFRNQHTKNTIAQIERVLASARSGKPAELAKVRSFMHTLVDHCPDHMLEYLPLGLLSLEQNFLERYMYESCERGIDL